MSGFEEDRAARNRSLRRAVLTTFSSRALSVLALLALTPILTRQLGAESFGVLITVTTTAFVLNMADFGIANGLVSKLASAPRASSRTKDLLSAATVLVVLSSALALVAAVFLTWMLPWPSLLNAPSHGSAQLRAATLIALAGVALSISTSLGQKLELAAQRGHAVAAWAATAAVSGPATAVAVGAVKPDLLLMTAAYSIVPPLILALQTIRFIRSLPPTQRPRLGEAHRDDVVGLLRSGGAFFGLAVVIAVSFQIDTLIVSSILGASAAGQFNVVVRLFGLTATVVQASLTQLWSAFAEAISRGDIFWVRRTIVRTSLSGTAITAASGLVIILAGPAAIEFWLGEAFRPSLALLFAAALWSVYSTAVHPLAMFLNGAQMQGIQLLAAIPMAVVNIALSIALTQEIGTPGPLLGSTIAHLLCISLPLGYVVRRRLQAWERISA